EALSLGFTPLEIAGTIRTAYNGHVAGTYSQEGQDYDIVLILRGEDRNNLERIRELTFSSPSGAQIPLENLVDIIEGEGPLEIHRLNRVRYIDVIAGSTGERALNRISADLNAAIATLGPPPVGIDLEIEGSSAEMTESFQSLLFALVLAVSLVYMVMASQFESFLSPLI